MTIGGARCFRPALTTTPQSVIETANPARPTSISGFRP